MWSLPYKYTTTDGGIEYIAGPARNPWVNPFYHHGPGVLAYFYPPDPRGIPAQRTDLVIPSYRLTLMRDGIQDRAVLENLELVLNPKQLQEIESNLKKMWLDNPVQWYIDYNAYRKARKSIYDLAFQNLK
ncbi:MAG: DUF4091 domain-containing protein [Phycisphaeraceae bacterium]|nr:DUF4091 domain-containing protein [Phycisphaeraceae bacterium]